jgi:class 3 adenylate cyclase/tetratricopeptide (TPR) repeat protein
LGLGQYEDAFRANAVDFALLPRLSGEELREIGVGAVGDRRRLLDAIAQLGAAESGPPAAQADERRQVAILFADLAGFTRLSTELDAEDLHRLRQAFTGEIRRCVAAFGGSSEREIGDCVMAVFGAPVSHDNDAERAVRAALAVQAAMPSLTEAFGRSIAAHIGIATGEVLAASGRDGALTVTGEVVNLASRLTSEAGTGEILVSHAVQRVLSSGLEGEETGPFLVKGFAEPVRAWRVSGLATARRPGRPLIGRQAELRQLDAALSACRDLGAGQVVVLRGEAGIGKTRLVEEARERASAAGFGCHLASILDFGAATDHGAAHALARSLAAASPEAPATLALPEATALQALLGEDLSPADRTVLAAMDHAARMRASQNALAGLVRAASRARPLLLVVEDVHWADAATLDALAAVAGVVSEAQVVLLLTSRVDGDPTASGLHLPGPLMTIDLAPLRRQDARAFAAAIHAAAERVVERCIDRAAGNPLFLEQLLRYAEEQGEGGVPESVQSLVQARIDRLAPADKEALQAASVLGQRLSAEALRHLLDRPADLAPLLGHHLLHPQGSELHFAHALIRDGVYATLPKSRRRELHGKAAAFFRGRDAGLHAEHLERAKDPAAPGAYAEAARHQMAAYRYDQALLLTDRGLGLEAGAADRFELHRLRGQILHDIGGISEAASSFAEALALATTDAERCQALLGRAGIKRITDDLDGALADLDEAEALARAHDLVAERARAHFLRGNILFPRGELDACAFEQQASLDLARQAGSAELEAAALGGLGDVEYMRGRMLTAATLFDRCAALARDSGLGRIEAANRPMLAISKIFAGDVHAALAEAERAVATATHTGHKRAEAIARHAMFFCYEMLDRHEEARAHVDRALAVAIDIGSPRFEAEALALRAVLDRVAGKPDAAQASLADALRILSTVGLSYLGPYCRGLAARLAGDWDTAAAALRDGEELLAGNRIGHNHILFRRDAIESCLAFERWDEAERHAGALEAFAAPEPSPWSDFLVARARLIAAFRRDARIEHRAELDALIEEARSRGFLEALPALERCRA